MALLRLKKTHFNVVHRKVDWRNPKMKFLNSTRYIAVRIAVRTSVPWYTAVRKFVAVPTPNQGCYETVRETSRLVYETTCLRNVWHSLKLIKSLK